MAQVPKALGYFREDSAHPAKATPGENGTTDSVADQNRLFLEFCKREGYQVAATFIDYAADFRERPGFRQLVDYLKGHRDANNVVVVSTVDRLSFDPSQAFRHLSQIDGLGSRLVSLDGEPDPTASILRHWETQSKAPPIGDRVREAMRKKAIRGEVLGRPPYGYHVGPKSRLEPVPPEATVVRYIFRMYTREGLGIRLIARRLNEEGLRTRRGGNWSMVTIRDILLNRAYLGTYTRLGVRVPGSHPALVTPDDYRRVQDRMASRRTSGGKRNLRQFLLSGLAFCGYCGNKMIGVSRRQTWTRRDGRQPGEAEYRYYQCLSRTNQSMCGYHTQRAGDLEEEVRLRAVAAAEKAMAAPENLGVAAPSVDENVEKLRARVRQLDRELDQYLQATVKHQMSRERLHELSVEVTQRQMDADEAIDQLENRRRIVESLGEQRRARAATLTDLRDAWEGLEFARRQELIREVVERVTVLDEGPVVLIKN